MNPNSKLNKKQKEFCRQYLIDLNASQAFIRAGYSPIAANVNSARLMAKDSIQKYIGKLMENREKRTEITQDMVLREYAKLAFFDPQKLYNEEGSLLKVTDLDKDVAAAIAGLEVAEFGGDNSSVVTKKVKFADKKGALDSLARHLGMFNDKLHHTGDLNISIMSDIESNENNKLTID